MMGVNLDNKLIKVLSESSCFGLAYSPEVGECKQCDVQAQCKMKTEGENVQLPPRSSKPKATQDKPDKAPDQGKPAKEKANSVKDTAKKAAQSQSSKPTPAASTTKTTSKPAAAVSGDMPEFKPMSLPELKELAKSRNVQWTEYGNDQITRMRLIMALKASY